MWRREDAGRPAGPEVEQSRVPPPGSGPETPIVNPKIYGGGPGGPGMVIGPRVAIKGELSGNEDLTIEGQLEGKIELRQNVLTIGPNARITAQVFAKAVIILGKVTGNVNASEKVD